MQRMRPSWLIMVVFAVSLALVSCIQEQKASPHAPHASLPILSAPVQIDSPIPPGAAQPYLHASADGTVVASWLRRDGAIHRLEGAMLQGGQWGEPFTVVERPDFFVNWADTPSIVRADDGTLFAHWLQKSGTGTYQYDVHLVTSRDSGRSWSDSVIPHQNPVSSEYGFVSLVPHAGRPAVAVAWLDGREMGVGGHDDHSGSMALRFADFSADGELTNEALLDDRTCECCQTGMARTDEGIVIVYRDRSEQEVRDIAVVRQLGGGWSAPALLYSDGWKIPGCPVNGPQIAATGNRATVVWFTGANERALIRASFTADGGRSWSEPLTVSDGEPLGRVDVEMIDESAAVVSWMQRDGDEASVRLRVIRSDGASEPVELGRTAAGRASGFPRMARSGNTIFVAWTVPGTSPRIVVASSEISRGENR
jgi:hypothetical protein